MVIPPDNQLKRDLVRLVHNKPTGGHMGRDWTLYTLSNIAWWPAMKAWVEEYVKGCAPCQQNKNINRRSPMPLYKITVPPHARPFKVVSMDLITQLPKSHGYDAILTIVDHGDMLRCRYTCESATLLRAEGSRGDILTGPPKPLRMCSLSDKVSMYKGRPMLSGTCLGSYRFRRAPTCQVAGR